MVTLSCCRSCASSGKNVYLPAASKPGSCDMGELNLPPVAATKILATLLEMWYSFSLLLSCCRGFRSNLPVYTVTVVVKRWLLHIHRLQNVNACCRFFDIIVQYHNTMRNLNCMVLTVIPAFAEILTMMNATTKITDRIWMSWCKCMQASQVRTYRLAAAAHVH